MAILDYNGNASMNTTPYANSDWTSGSVGTYRGFGADWFNAENIAKEDWVRQEQSAQNAFERSLYQNQLNNDFNASEAQKDRDFQSQEATTAYNRQRELRQTAYQDTISDLKAAGINPLLAVTQGASSSASVQSASGSRASSGSSSSGGSGHSAGSGIPSKGQLGSVLGTIGSIATAAMAGSLQASKIASTERIAAMKNSFTDITTDSDGVVKYIRQRSNNKK
ncbi:DNA pilot protein [Peromfec virus RodF5_7]|uniref:DNA pilot protein n=1 Tax=Peromfec virus RodF5_7 TaxID=2929343 RepID=A0A976N2J9_9VIRU|nr:DNA pilot protein [Peromfec virus RodF5_7]